MAKPRRPFVISDLPSTRADAVLVGSDYYYTGKPCKRGHIEPRSTTHFRCRQCNTDSTVRSHQTPRGIIQNRERNRRFERSPKGRVRQRVKGSKRRAMQRSAIPLWADMCRINDFIKGCPPGFDIDHIIPLKAKNVCGLHVLENLQFLPMSENRSKSNKVDPLTLDHAICVLPGHRTYTHG